MASPRWKVLGGKEKTFQRPKDLETSGKGKEYSHRIPNRPAGLPIVWAYA